MGTRTVLCAGAIAAGLAAWVGPAPTRAWAGQEASAAETFATPRDLLLALEKADERIRTLRADVQYDRFFRLQGDQHRRQGTLLFRAERSGDGRVRRAFQIDFSRLYVDDRLEDDPQVWVFDGRWLVEKRPAQKQWIKREIAGENDSFDPLRIGEGPMPIPIGQRADEVLARYDAELLPASEPFEPGDARADFVKDTWLLRLTPRAGRPDEDEFKEICIWYRKADLLPRMSRTISRAGDESFVQLINLSINEELPAGAFDVSPPPLSEGWQVQVEELPRRTDGREGGR